MTTKYGPIVEPELMCNLHVIRLLATDDASRSLFAMLIELRCASMAGLADGFVPADLLRHSTKHHEPEMAIAELVRLGLAAEVEGGWQLDWSGQVSADTIEQKQASGKAWDAHRRGNHANCEGRNYNCHTNGDLQRWKEANDDRTAPVRGVSVQLPRGNSTQLYPTQPNGVKGLVGGESKPGAPAKKDAAGASLSRPPRKGSKAAPKSKAPRAGAPKKAAVRKTPPATQRSTPEPKPALPEYQRFFKLGAGGRDHRNPVQIRRIDGGIALYVDEEDLLNVNRVRVQIWDKRAAALITAIETGIRELFTDRTGTALTETERDDWLVAKIPVPVQHRAGIVELAVEARKKVLLEQGFVERD